MLEKGFVFDFEVQNSPRTLSFPFRITPQAERSSRGVRDPDSEGARILGQRVDSNHAGARFHWRNIRLVQLLQTGWRRGCSKHAGDRGPQHCASLAALVLPKVPERDLYDAHLI